MSPFPAPPSFSTSFVPLPSRTVLSLLCTWVLAAELLSASELHANTSPDLQGCYLLSVWKFLWAADASVPAFSRQRRQTLKAVRTQMSIFTERVREETKAASNRTSDQTVKESSPWKVRPSPEQRRGTCLPVENQNQNRHLQPAAAPSPLACCCCWTSDFKNSAFLFQTQHSWREGGREGGLLLELEENRNAVDDVGSEF